MNLRLVLFASIASAACGSDPGMTTREDVVVTNPDAEPIAPHSVCEVTTYREPALSRTHQEMCSELELESMPPTGGDHFGIWASWGTYTETIPWGFLIHSMEHGGVVLAYNCEDCPEVVAELERIAQRDDPICRDEDARARFIVVPMPDLDVPIAALAWEHGYLATCLDSASLESFVDEHYGMAPEDLCFSGIDMSAEGWCS